ncbi:hypothetical protein ACFX2A_034708 [Malus domestica]
MHVLDLLIFDSASPLLYLTFLFSLLFFLSYFFSLIPDSLFLKTSLSIYPKVHSVLHRHAVAPGSYPKFLFLSPDKIRISVWNLTVNSFVVGGFLILYFYIEMVRFCLMIVEASDSASTKTAPTSFQITTPNLSQPPKQVYEFFFNIYISFPPFLIF